MKCVKCGKFTGGPMCSAHVKHIFEKEGGFCGCDIPEYEKKHNQQEPPDRESGR